MQESKKLFTTQPKSMLINASSRRTHTNLGPGLALDKGGLMGLVNKPLPFTIGVGQGLNGQFVDCSTSLTGDVAVYKGAIQIESLDST